MPIHLSQLDDGTVTYLTRLTATPRPPEHPGVLIARPRSLFAGPRGGRYPLVLLGLAGLAVAVAAVVNGAARSRPELGGVAAATAVAAGVGLLALFAGVARFRRADPGPRTGNFLFADAARVWDVTDGWLTTYEYADDIDVSGADHTQNGAYTHSVLTVRSTPWGTKSWTVYDRVAGQRFFEFLQLIRHLRRSDDPPTRAFAASGSAQVAAFVLRLLDRTPDDVPSPPAAEPPRPAPRPDAPPVPGVGWGRAAVRGLVAVAVAAATGFGTHAALDALRESRLFAAITADPAPSTRAVDAYLAEYPAGSRSAVVREVQDERLFAPLSRPARGDLSEVFAADRYLTTCPTGRHVAEARDFRDDARFVLAKGEAAKADSPGGVRAYLAERDNTRHRAEAQQLIVGYYERVTADLTARAEKPMGKAGGKVDPRLIRSMIALVESLKTADNPVLTVGFVPEIEAAPKGETKDGEDETYRWQLAEGKFNNELKALEASNANKTALIPHADTFAGDYVTSREDMIFRRMYDAIERGIKPDILTLQRAQAGERPNVEVRYRVFPAGFVVPFNEVNDDNSHKRTIGLVREYYIDWTILFRPAGGREPLTYRTQTRPGPNLLYRPASGDPDWAIYAVSLYSAFYGLSDQMIRALGQDPGDMPDAFTWTGMSSFRKSDTKLSPLLPKFEFPKLPGTKQP